ncbi:MAG: hypothetical protein AAGD11_15460 [Planctomycetota bacterium]
MSRLLREPLAPLIVFACMMTLFFVAYLVEAKDVSLLFETTTSGFWGLLLVYWIIADTRQRNASSCTDFGFLCVMFFPLSVPWHCFRSRGWRGVFTLLLLFVIWILPYLVAMTIWITVYGR